MPDESVAFVTPVTNVESVPAPLHVANNLPEAPGDLESRVEKQITGTRASVSMGEIRTINVFVLGEAMFPGSYTVSGLATTTTPDSGGSTVPPGD